MSSDNEEMEGRWKVQTKSSDNKEMGGKWKAYKEWASIHCMGSSPINTKKGGGPVTIAQIAKVSPVD